MHKNDLSICVVCRPGYTSTTDGTCAKCIEGCELSCNPANVSECQSNRVFLFSQQGLAESFPVGCFSFADNNCYNSEFSYKLVYAGN